MQHEDNVDMLCNIMENVAIDENNLVRYIRSLPNISHDLKQHLIHLVENDCYEDYLQIYNICLENDIELPVP